MQIELTDNNSVSANNRFQRDDIAALFPFGDKTIAELCRDHEHLLVFPESIEECDDEIGNGTLYSIQNTDNPDEVRVVTGNIMGFVGIGNIKLKIKSRFDLGQNDYFLHYMLQKVLALNMFDLDLNSGEEGLSELLMLMFPHLLKSAIQQGVFRQYQCYNHNDSNVHGNINVSQYLRNNVPFSGRFAYTTHEYSRDNDVTQLIRHTIEFMQSTHFGRCVLSSCRETTENIKIIKHYTTLYSKVERAAVINRNLRLKSHPYYTKYRSLQLLCIQILRMEEVKYGEDDNEIHGVLFDGAWLWEEYVATLLRDCRFIHAENRLRKKGIALFTDGSGLRYPDFYNDEMVLDAKYKRLEECKRVAEVDRNDIHQIITYMTALHVKRGGFVAPLTAKTTEIVTAHLRDGVSMIGIYGVQIATSASSYIEFVVQMQQHEKDFLASIES